MNTKRMKLDKRAQSILPEADVHSLREIHAHRLEARMDRLFQVQHTSIINKMYHIKYDFSGLIVHFLASVFTSCEH